MFRPDIALCARPACSRSRARSFFSRCTRESICNWGHVERHTMCCVRNIIFWWWWTEERPKTCGVFCNTLISRFGGFVFWAFRCVAHGSSPIGAICAFVRQRACSLSTGEIAQSSTIHQQTIRTISLLVTIPDTIIITTGAAIARRPEISP